MLKRLASFSFRKKWLVLAVWLVVAVGLTFANSAAGGTFGGGSDTSNSDSSQAYRLLKKEFPSAGGEEVSIVLQSADGIAKDQAAIETYLAKVKAMPRVASVVSPFEAPEQLSADGRIGFANVAFTPTGSGLVQDTTAQMESSAKALDQPTLKVAFAGYQFKEGSVPDSEIYGIGAAMLILLIAFGSVVAMGLPILTALVGIVIGLAGVGLWSAAVPTPDFTVQVASMIGIGVGIDYALFIVTRYREALHRGATPHDAVMEAANTAGRAVVFAGGTVMVSLLGMILMGVKFFNGLAFGSSTAVLVAVLAASTLLPALLGVVGRKVEFLSIHRKRKVATTKETFWHRWSRFVQRHSKGFTIGGLTVLVALSVPLLAMRQASADAGNDPKGSTTRVAYDLLSEGFGPGFNGPLVVALETPTDAAVAKATAVADTLRSTPGIAFASEVQPSPSGKAAVISIIPTTSPQSRATESLVHHLRADVLPPFHTDGLIGHVGGATASNVDFAQLMSSRLPIFIGVVLVVSFLLLMVVFRSILVPLKAVIMNLLSISAAYGLMVAVFQWGWLGGLFKVSQGAPIEPWAPMMLFAIMFGLSMDYEVFLLSSIRERYDESGNNTEAVVEGLASTARIITAAAAIMICVFAPFVFGNDRGIRLIGFGLAAAVFIDATIVRMIVVPATMELLGNRNWWFPRWLDRVVPHAALA
jgi:putative drug exporter of the RND superfamily